jgi:hypothetical protein
MVLCNWRAISSIRIIELGRREEAPTIFSDSQCTSYGYTRVVGYPGSQEGAGKNCLHNWETVRIEAYNCDGPSPTARYDFINGNCTLNTLYNTPGKYSLLSDCEASIVDNSCKSPNICVPPDYCPPGMVCLPSSEFSQISALSSSLENENCS